MNVESKQKIKRKSNTQKILFKKTGIVSKSYIPILSKMDILSIEYFIEIIQSYV